MGNRSYSDLTMEECLAAVTEEVEYTGDSFGWIGDISPELTAALEKRGIVFSDDLLGSWVKDPDFTVNPDEIPYLVNKAMEEYRKGRTGPLTDEEKEAWGSSSFKLGNKKLGEDTIVFNMTSGHDCPCRGKCDVKENCYAVADEKLWGTPLAYRRRQTAFWDSVTPKEFVDAMPIPQYFRFSESGDFRTQEDVNKMTAVANLLDHLGMRTYGYTNRDDLNLDELCKVAIVNGHGFMASNKTVIKEKIEKGDDVCPGDCRYCDWCKVSTGRTIVFPKRRR